jgi:3-hydroxyisobutyrate dehydrogenase-like beta-hydroxyacid dehydrogenase
MKTGFIGLGSVSRPTASRLLLGWLQEAVRACPAELMLALRHGFAY